MRYCIFDLESDGLLNTVTKLHCLCASIFEDGVLIFSVELTNIEEIIIFLDQQDILIGHNVIMYDLPVQKSFIIMNLKEKYLILYLLVGIYILIEKNMDLVYGVMS
jgi:hypothetical protein